MSLKGWIEIRDLRSNEAIATGYVKAIEEQEPPAGLHLFLDKGYEIYINYEALAQIIDKHAEQVLDTKPILEESE